jgi:spore coat polysaccharide biosynthesis protein SpsF
MSKPVVLIQCRTSSTRLPGKALLPVAGMASAVLCARRAARTGLDVRIATSTEGSDDALCAILQAHGVPYFRGALNNVLARFAEALQAVADDVPVVRLTADNLFVDGPLIDEAVRAFEAQGTGYLSLHPPALTGAPYGLSVEVTTAGSIRAARAGAADDFEREHVTPWITRRYGHHAYRPRDLRPGQSHLRCTMDTWTDYQRMLAVFSKASDPVSATWQELCDWLHAISPRLGIPLRHTEGGSVAELALGTVQLGLPYGVANMQGQPSFEQARAIVQRAVAQGATHLDCAAAYGEAEARLGRILDQDLLSRVTVVTKLSPLSGLAEDAGDQEVTAQVDASVYRSCWRLRMSVLPYLLLHRWQHRTSHGGRVWERLRQLRQEGVIRRLGVSVQGPLGALEAIADPEIAFVQLPFNPLDRRLQRAGFTDLAGARADVVVQARSVFLQGLLMSPEARWPAIPGVDAAAIVGLLTGLARRFGREGVADLCISYVRAQRWVDCLVIGVETLHQLDRNVALFQNPPLLPEQCAQLEATFSDLPDTLLDPARWPRA